MKRFDTYCTDRECCNPGGYHHHETTCPRCGSVGVEFMPDGRDPSTVQCYHCEHIYQPQPILMED